MKFLCVRSLLALIGLWGALPSALAFKIDVTAGAPNLYLQVGEGAFSRTPAARGGTGQALTTVNVVEKSLSSAELLARTPLAMSPGSIALSSFGDGNPTCVPGEVQVAGMYRNKTNEGAATATLVATVPASLSSPEGYVIPFSEISWTSKNLCQSTCGQSQPFPANTFLAGATMTLGTVLRNQWAESCMSFSYANSAVRAASYYKGTVIYTLSAP